MIQLGSKVMFLKNSDYRVSRDKIYTVETAINRGKGEQIKLFYVCREDPESRIYIVADEDDLKLIK